MSDEGRKYHVIAIGGESSDIQEADWVTIRESVSLQNAMKVTLAMLNGDAAMSVLIKKLS